MSPRISGHTSSMASPACPLGSHPVVSLRPWSPQAPWDARGCPCHLTWVEYGDTSPPAPGTRMDIGHPRMIESRGLVCRCERGSAVNRGERETATHLPRLPHNSPELLQELPEFPSWVYLGALPCPTHLFPAWARITHKNVDLNTTAFTSSTATRDSEHRC